VPESSNVNALRSAIAERMKTKESSLLMLIHFDFTRLIKTKLQHLSGQPLECHQMTRCWSVLSRSLRRVITFAREICKVSIISLSAEHQLKYQLPLSINHFSFWINETYLSWISQVTVQLSSECLTLMISDIRDQPYLQMTQILWCLCTLPTVRIRQSDRATKQHNATDSSTQLKSN
jgi:hypothetical protein